MHCRLNVLMAEHDPPLNQTQLMEKTGLSNHTVGKLFNNTFKRVDRSTVEALVRFFNCDLSELFVLKEVAND